MGPLRDRSEAAPRALSRPSKASHHYGELQIRIAMTEKAKPLMTCAAEQGFFDLGVSYLKDVCGAMEWEYSTTTLAGLLKAMTEAIWPGCGLDQVEKVLAARMAHLDDVDGLDDLLGVEWITDMFDKSTAEEVLDEVKHAKSHQVMRKEFLSEFDGVKDRAFLRGGGGRRRRHPSLSSACVPSARPPPLPSTSALLCPRPCRHPAPPSPHFPRSLMPLLA